MHTAFRPSRRPVAEIPDDPLSQWEHLTHLAREAHDLGRLGTAIAVHAHALRLAETLLQDTPELDTRPDDCLAAYVVSHHNLSELQLGRGRNAQAADHLSRPHRRLIALIDDVSTLPHVRDAAWRHLRETGSQLLLWRSRRGAHPLVDLALRTTPAVAAPVQ